mgnify:CR=1 FL=1
MIINHKYKFIFIKTRKTAGTSIEVALSKFCDENDVITPIAKEDELLRQKKGFRGEQNCNVPWHRYRALDWLNLVFKARRLRFKNHSEAAFIRRYIDEEIWNSYFKFCFERNPFDKAISRYYWSAKPPRPEISEYLSSASQRRLSNWGTYTIDDQLVVDFVGRYETLADDLATIGNKLGLPEELSLPRAKGSHRQNREHYSRVLNQEARARIEAVCAKEIQAFDYAWTEPQDAE